MVEIELRLILGLVSIKEKGQRTKSIAQFSIHIRISAKDKNIFAFLALVKITTELANGLRVSNTPDTQSIARNSAVFTVSKLFTSTTVRCEPSKENHFDVKRRIVIGPCTLGIKTPLQLTTLNVMGASIDLFDVTMDLQHGKFTSGNVGHTY